MPSRAAVIKDVIRWQDSKSRLLSLQIEVASDDCPVTLKVVRQNGEWHDGEVEPVAMSLGEVEVLVSELRAAMRFVEDD